MCSKCQTSDINKTVYFVVYDSVCVFFFSRVLQEFESCAWKQLIKPAKFIGRTNFRRILMLIYVEHTIFLSLIFQCHAKTKDKRKYKSTHHMYYTLIRCWINVSIRTFIWIMMIREQFRNMHHTLALLHCECYALFVMIASICFVNIWYLRRDCSANAIPIPLSFPMYPVSLLNKSKLTEESKNGIESTEKCTIVHFIINTLKLNSTIKFEIS